VNHHMLHHLNPEQVEVEIWRADALEVHRGLSSELDEMWSYGRCFRSVDSSSDSYPKFVAVDEETQHEIMHRGRFGKTDRTTHEPLDPRTQIDVLAFDLLRMGFANRVLRGINMTLVGAPSIGRESGDVQRGQELLQLEKHVILPSPKAYANTVPL
jgi:hypothetical protein